MKTLEHLRQSAYNAYRNISFSPEKRAETIVSDYSDELDADLANMPEDRRAQYKQLYEALLSAWLHSLANCASSMITGPANFPSARMQKRNRWADNRYKEFRDWRDRVLEAQARAERKAEVEAQGGELEIAKKRLVNLEKRQERMKAVNVAFRAWKKKPESLETADLTDQERELIKSWQSACSYETAPFQSYQLTNNNAKIKHWQDRVKVLEAKESSANTIGQAGTTFEGGVKL